jgi:exonuclease III
LRVNTQDGELFIYNVYVPPDKRKFSQLCSFVARVEAIAHRNENAKMIIFGDFNTTRDDIKELLLEKLKGFNVRIHMDCNLD